MMAPLGRALSIVWILAPVIGQAQYLRGVNVSQAEWGDPLTGRYGPDYSYPTAPTFNYFSSRALGFIRLQVQWERLQPTLGGALDPTNLNYLKQEIAWAKAAGAVVSIVTHNQARYSLMLNGVETLCIIDNPCGGNTVLVTAANLADFWVKMSNEFKNEPAVYAYDLMNEPHDMGVANWSQISQTVVSAVRNNGDNKVIMVPGDGWSSALYWPFDNGLSAWIHEPANNYYYEAHEYFDSDGSGTYAMTYDQELANNPNLKYVGTYRLQFFTAWCSSNHVPCYLGEYGIPNNDPRWLTVLDNFLHALDVAQMPGTYWAAGELWALVPGCPCSLLSVQPSDNFTTDQEQLPTLLAHLAPGSFRTASAAASYGWALAPGELVAGYGSRLTSGSGQTAQVQLTDSAGNVLNAPLLYVSPQQINYQVPAGAVSGLVNVKVTDSGSTTASGVLLLQNVAPTIFTANQTGQGVAAAQIQRVKPDGSYTYEDVAVYDSGSHEFVASPIAFNGDRIFLLLYGTGFDRASGAAGTTVAINATQANVTYSGPQPQFAGEDQIDAELAPSLAGAGQATMTVTVDGVTANAVTITFQ